MYKIEKKLYGYKLTFGDKILVDEMARWVKDSTAALATASGSFSIFVDMRTLQPLDDATQAEMQKGQKLYKAKGMARSVVIVASAIVAMQFKRLARSTGIYEWERYISEEGNPTWEKKGLDWVEKSIDPDK